MRGNILRLIIVAIILIPMYFIMCPNEDKLLTLPTPQHQQYQYQYIPAILWTDNVSCHGYKETDKTLIITVSTARSNFDRRQLIRESWGSIKNFDGWSIMAVKFLLGQAALPNEEPVSVSQKLEIERTTYGDLILGSFIDTYRNLTLKTLTGYKWLSQFCPQAQAVVKMDDDVVLNVFQLIKLLNDNPHLYQNSSNYYGDTHQGTNPVRIPKHRWFVSKEDYPSDVYPRYVSGWGQLLTLEVVNKILGEVVHVKHHTSMEDIFLTGVVADSYNARVINGSEENPILRLHINGTWQFDLDEDSDYPENLRKWYENHGGVSPQNVTKDVQNPLFYIIGHFESFEEDFLGTWNKIKETEMSSDY